VTLRQTLVRRAPLPAPSRPGSATACHLKHLSDDAPMLPARHTRGSLSIRADTAQPAAKRGEAGPSCRSGCARLAPQDRARAFHPGGSDLDRTVIALTVCAFGIKSAPIVLEGVATGAPCTLKVLGHLRR